MLAKDPDPVLGRELLGLTERQRACLEAGDLATFTQLDMEFHRRMYQAAALPDLWLLNRSRSGNLDRLRRLHLPMNGKALSILEQHAQIARSIGRGDPAAARHTVRSHLGGTLNAIDALRSRYPDLLLPADYAAPAADA